MFGVANDTLPLLGFSLLRSDSLLNAVINELLSTGYDSLGVAVPLFVNDDIFELL